MTSYIDANKLKFKRTAVSGKLPDVLNSANTSFIDKGQFSFNLADQKMYSSNGSFAFEIGANLTNLSVSNTITTHAIVANGQIGQVGQALTSDGSKIYWSDVIGYTGSRGIIGYTGSQGPSGSSSSENTFEAVSKNIKSYSSILNYIGDSISSIVYDLDNSNYITKTFAYTPDGLVSSIVLSGSTPMGIDLTKQLNYSGNTLIGVTYL